MAPALRYAGQVAHERAERAAYAALPLRQRIHSETIKTPATKAEWEAVMAELDTLNHPQMRAYWEKEWAKIPVCAGGYEQKTREGQILGTTRATLLWVHSEARRIAGELLRAEFPGGKAPDVSIYSAPFMALVAAEMEEKRPAHAPLLAAALAAVADAEAADAVAAADSAQVEAAAKLDAAHREMKAACKRCPVRPTRVHGGPLFEAAVRARVNELCEEAKHRQEEASILVEAKRRLAVEMKMEQLRRAAADGV
jgi:hypothetical protein